MKGPWFLELPAVACEKLGHGTTNQEVAEG